MSYEQMILEFHKILQALGERIQVFDTVLSEEGLVDPLQYGRCHSLETAVILALAIADKLASADQITRRNGR